MKRLVGVAALLLLTSCAPVPVESETSAPETPPPSTPSATGTDGPEEPSVTPTPSEEPSPELDLVEPPPVAEDVELGRVVFGPVDGVPTVSHAFGPASSEGPGFDVEGECRGEQDSVTVLVKHGGTDQATAPELGTFEIECNTVDISAHSIHSEGRDDVPVFLELLPEIGETEGWIRVTKGPVQ